MQVRGKRLLLVIEQQDSLCPRSLPVAVLVGGLESEASNSCDLSNGNQRMCKSPAQF